MTQTQESFETIKKRYVKANSEYKQKILRKYGVKDINKLSILLNNSSNEVKCNMTELARILLNHPTCNMKISFQKQVKLEDVLDELMETYSTTSPQKIEKAFKQSLVKGLNGIERVAQGFHNGKLDNFGRLYFVDEQITLDKSKSYDNRMILISLNHLNWVEVNNVKYILK